MRTASILRKATFGAVLVAAAIFATLPVRGADKRIVLIAGRPSHPPGMHEFRAGSLLLQKALSGVPGIKVDVYDMGWPAQDGRRRPRRRQFAARHRRCRAHLCRRRQGQSRDPGRADEGDRRAGGAAAPVSASRTTASKCRPACRATPSSAGSAGYYETNWSVNPMWKPDFQKFPTHPITRGVGPFATHDEWYFNMRWTPDAALKGRITPILVAKPSDEVRKGPYVSPKRPVRPHHRGQRQGRDDDVGGRAAGRRPQLRLHRRPHAHQLGRSRISAR